MQDSGFRLSEGSSQHVVGLRPGDNRAWAMYMKTMSINVWPAKTHSCLQVAYGVCIHTLTDLEFHHSPIQHFTFAISWLACPDVFVLHGGLFSGDSSECSQPGKPHCQDIELYPVILSGACIRVPFARGSKKLSLLDFNSQRNVFSVLSSQAARPDQYWKVQSSGAGLSKYRIATSAITIIGTHAWFQQP